MDAVLIANRGEIAERVQRTCRRLGIRTVAVYSDADAGARFVRTADLAVPLGGTTPSESYLRADAIVAAARAAGADAVHPGYGFLAENAPFARAVIDAGLTWIGPSPEAIATMGDKITAKATVAAAGVPNLPGATVGDGTDLASLGLPLLVKASAGGGGKGMHVVRRPEDLEGAIARARREALSAFGDDAVFVERYVERGRHIEVQVFGDSHGKVLSLFERECSLQRRHQKVLEEAPSPVIDPALRERLGAAAVAAARAVDYVGAGTVEFLLAPEREFFFLEMNTRLQVEHPVTEEVTGLDLVELQLLVAGGAPLPPLEPRISGHAIEVRLYAEDPGAEFLPSTGTLHAFRIPGDGLRVESGVEDGSVVSPYYDPMLAKVVAHGATREEAARRLAARLAEAQLHGVRTNRDMLVRILRDPAFLAGDIDTGTLERAPALRAPLVEDEALYALAGGLAVHARRACADGPWVGLPAGWRNNRSEPHRVRLTGAQGEHVVEYEAGRDGLRVEGADVVECAPELVRIVVGGVLRSFRTAHAGATLWVSGPDGECEFTEVPRFPAAGGAAAGSLEAPMPGRVLRVDACVGDEVTVGTVLAVIEAMKMELEITAPHDGRVSELRIAVGDQIDAGKVLAVIEGDTE